VVERALYGGQNGGIYFLWQAIETDNITLVWE
jgi:hypothetical protein